MVEEDGGCRTPAGQGGIANAEGMACSDGPDRRDTYLGGTGGKRGSILRKLHDEVRVGCDRGGAKRELGPVSRMVAGAAKEENASRSVDCQSGIHVVPCSRPANVPSRIEADQEETHWLSLGGAGEGRIGT